MFGATNPLARELAFYEVHKPEWLLYHENQFAVVAGVTSPGSTTTMKVPGMLAPGNLDCRQIFLSSRSASMRQFILCIDQNDSRTQVPELGKLRPVENIGFLFQHLVL